MLSLDLVKFLKSLLVLLGIIVIVVETIVPQFGVLLLTELSILLNIDVILEEFVVMFTKGNENIFLLIIVLLSQLLLIGLLILGFFHILFALFHKSLVGVVLR